MDDLSAMIGEVLSNPESVKQLQQVAASLGLADSLPDSGTLEPVAAPSNLPAPTTQSGGSLPNIDLNSLSRVLSNLSGRPAALAQPPNPSPAPDLSGLSELLSGLGNSENTPSPPSPAPDLSGLAGLLGNLGNDSTSNSSSSPDLSGLAGLLGASNASTDNSGTAPDLSGLAGLLGNLGSGSASNSSSPDLSGLAGLLGGLGGGGGGSENASTAGALANLLGGAPQNSGGGSGLPGINLDTILKVQQAMSSMSENKENVRLLLSLKGHLSGEREKKVDDAVRVMQMIQFLPLLKESGLFGSLEQVLGNFRLDQVLGGGNRSGSGLSGLLGGLNLFGGR